MAKEIKMFEAEDGSRHNSMKEAVEHENNARINSKLAEFVEAEFCSNMSKDEIFDTITETRKTLLRILQGDF